jgi:hypothetical protein
MKKPQHYRVPEKPIKAEGSTTPSQDARSMTAEEKQALRQQQLEQKKAEQEQKKQERLAKQLEQRCKQVSTYRSNQSTRAEKNQQYHDKRFAVWVSSIEKRLANQKEGMDYTGLTAALAQLRTAIITYDAAAIAYTALLSQTQPAVCIRTPNTESTDGFPATASTGSLDTAMLKQASTQETTELKAAREAMQKALRAVEAAYRDVWKSQPKRVQMESSPNDRKESRGVENMPTQNSDMQKEQGVNAPF